MTTSNSTTPTTRPANIAISFPTSGGRPSARYVSDTLVREEALQGGRMVGLYWSASGQVQRENVAAGLPGIDPITRPIHVFELEIDGQDLRNRWDWVSGPLLRLHPPSSGNAPSSISRIRSSTSQ